MKTLGVCFLLVCLQSGCSGNADSAAFDTGNSSTPRCPEEGSWSIERGANAPNALEDFLFQCDRLVLALISLRDEHVGDPTDEEIEYTHCSLAAEVRDSRLLFPPLSEERSSIYWAQDRFVLREGDSEILYHRCASEPCASQWTAFREPARACQLR